MSTPCSTFTYAQRPEDAWALELHRTIDSKDMQQMVTITKDEMMSGSPLPWPETPYEEGVYERKMIMEEKCAAYDAEQYKLHGNDERVKALLCDETELDLHCLLWKASRADDIDTELQKFFAFYNDGCLQQALFIGWWLLDQHATYDACLEADVLRVLKETMSKALEEDFAGWKTEELIDFTSTS